VTTANIFSTDDKTQDWAKLSAAFGMDPFKVLANAKLPTAGSLIYCDGACSGNGTKASPVGGWGFILMRASGPMVLGHGRAQPTTNNRMEMTAAIEALKATPSGEVVTVRSDSQYMIKGCTEWRKGWVKRGMKNSGGEPVLNPDLWKSLWAEVDLRKVVFEWVRGHNGNPGNELADRLATYGARA